MVAMVSQRAQWKYRVHYGIMATIAFCLCFLHESYKLIFDADFEGI